MDSVSRDLGLISTWQFTNHVIFDYLFIFPKPKMCFFNL